jgi:O-antigen ligase
MKILKFIILSLILLNIPAIVLFNFGASLGSLFSYVTILLLVVFYFLERKTTPNWWIIILALSYYLIISFQYYGVTKDFIMEFVKYLIFVICGYELTKRVTNVELFYYLLFGVISIGIHALFYPTRFGRYSGFYINPNVAGFICIYGYSLVYSLKSTSLKLLGQFIFTLMGLLTFSRTFIVIWVLLNIISLRISIKNIRILGIGVLLFSTLIFIDEVVGLNNPRFQQLRAIATNEEVSIEEVNEGSRTETWAKYYDKIFESPIFGSGYGTFSGKMNSEGVHNTYLMIIGEAGIIPFFIFIAFIIYLYYWSIIFFKRSPNLIMQTIALSIFLLANHNFFSFYYVTFAAMWIQYQIYKLNVGESNDEKILEA